MVDARRRPRRHRRLGVIGDAEAGGLDHGEIVGAVADRQRVDGGEAEGLAQLQQRRELGVAAEDRLLDLRRSACRRSTMSVLARFSWKPIMAATRVGEQA